MRRVAGARPVEAAAAGTGTGTDMATAIVASGGTAAGTTAGTSVAIIASAGTTAGMVITAGVAITAGITTDNRGDFREPLRNPLPKGGGSTSGGDLGPESARNPAPRVRN